MKPMAECFAEIPSLREKSQDIDNPLPSFPLPGLMQFYVVEEQTVRTLYCWEKNNAKKLINIYLSIAQL